MFGILAFWVAMLPYPLLAIPKIYRHGFWLSPDHATAVAAYIGIFLWLCGLGAVMWLPVRDRRIKEKVACAAMAARARAHVGA
jgi:hypothetical protein